MFFDFFCTGQTDNNNNNNTHNGHQYILGRRCSCWTMDDDARRDATARLVRFSDIYTAHQQTTTCLKINLHISKMAQFTLKRTQNMMINSCSQKPGLIFLINEHVSILVLRQSYREPAAFRDLVTTGAPRFLAWHPNFAFASKICTKDPLSEETSVKHTVFLMSQE
jgi:hypothetical protein